MEWLNSLSGNTASLIGTLLGSALGLIAILMGAMFNAHLNRRRDDRIRKGDRDSIAAALQAELSLIAESLKSNALVLSDSEVDYLIRDVTHSTSVRSAVLPRLGLLGSKLVSEVIEAYGLVDQYTENLLVLGGQMRVDEASKRRLILMKKSTAKNVSVMNENYAAKIDATIESLKQ